MFHRTGKTSLQNRSLHQNYKKKIRLSLSSLFMDSRDKDIEKRTINSEFAIADLDNEHCLQVFYLFQKKKKVY